MSEWKKTRVRGIYVRSGTYHLKKKYLGQWIRQTTGITEGRGRLKEAEAILHAAMDQIRQQKLLGISGRISFGEAAIEYCLQHQHQATITHTEAMLRRLCDHYLDMVPIGEIHSQCPAIERLVRDLTAGAPAWGKSGHGHKERDPKPRKKKTLKAYLEIVTRVLNFCARDWRDPLTNEPHLGSVPRFKLDMIENDQRQPLALSWEQQRVFERHLSPHLQRIFLYCINSGLRDFEITNLRWEWEMAVEGCESVFVVPGWWQGVKITKNGQNRVSVINKVCRSILDEVRGKHDEFVFTFRGNPVTRVVNTGWNNARATAAGEDPALADLHFHDCRHTFGHRLESVGVDQRTIRTLLGHVSGDITEHYTQQDLTHLQRSAELATKQTKAVPILSVGKVYK